MKSYSKDGGPAFPASVEDKRDGDGYAGKQTGPHSGIETGMTLRDYFAAKAMLGMENRYTGGPAPSPVDLADYAYSVADAMLERRND